MQHHEKLHEFHSYWLFLPKKIKIEKVAKPVTNLHGKTEYVIHIRNLKQALNHGLILEKVLRVTKFNQKSWLKLCIDMHFKLRKKSKK